MTTTTCGRLPISERQRRLLTGLPLPTLIGLGLLLAPQLERGVSMPLLRPYLLGYAAPLHELAEVLRWGALAALLALLASLTFALLRLLIWQVPAGRYWELRIPLPARVEPDEAPILWRLLAGSLAQVPAGQIVFGAELWGGRSEPVRLGLWVPDRPGVPELLPALRRALLGLRPDTRLVAAPDPLVASQPGELLAWAELALRAHASLPLAEADLLGPLLGALNSQATTSAVGVQVLVRPAPRGWQVELARAAERLRQRARASAAGPVPGGEATSLAAMPVARALSEKAAGQAFCVRLRVLAIAPTQAQARQERALLLGALQAADQYHGWRRQGWRVVRSGITRRVPRLLARRAAPPVARLLPCLPISPGVVDLLPSDALLGQDELARLWRLPEPGLGQRIDWQRSRPITPPAFAFTPDAPATPHDTHLRLLTATRADGSQGYVGPTLRDLRLGLHVVAPMGYGKSHLLKLLAHELLRVGAGFLCQDHKGDLADDLLAMIPQQREADVCVFDPTDSAWPIGLNLLAGGPGLAATSIAEQAQSLFARVDPGWAEALGMQEFARNGLLALTLGEAAPTLLHLQRFFVSAGYRERVCGRLGAEGALVREFWLSRYPRLPEQQRQSLQALLRRLGIFLTHPLTRGIVAQPGARLDLRRLMDRGGLLIAKIPVEHVGEQVGQFLSTLLLARVVLAVLSRQGLPEALIRDWPLIVDEFQVALGASSARDVEAMISRFRAFGAGPVFAHQSLSQLGHSAGLAEQLLANLQNRVVLGARAGDAAVFARQWRGQLLDTDVLGLRRRESAYAELVVGERETKLFSCAVPALWPLPALDVAPYAGHTWQSIRASAQNALDAWLDARAADVERLRLGAGEDAALDALVAAPEAVWQALVARSSAHRAAQRTYIVANPGCIPQKAERIRWLSRLAYARPRLEVMADIQRTLLALPTDE